MRRACSPVEGRPYYGAHRYCGLPKGLSHDIFSIIGPRRAQLGAASWDLLVARTRVVFAAFGTTAGTIVWANQLWLGQRSIEAPVQTRLLDFEDSLLRLVGDEDDERYWPLGDEADGVLETSGAIFQELVRGGVEHANEVRDAAAAVVAVAAAAARREMVVDYI